MVPNVAGSNPVDRPLLRGVPSLNLFQAILLGLVQGATEFFPISSSSHLKLTRELLGIANDEGAVFFELTCHFGTWVSLAFFLRHEIWQTLKNPRKIALFVVALCPLIPMYLLLKPVRILLSAPHYTGYLLLVTACLLFLACKVRRASLNTEKWRDVLLVGVSQSFALLPGLSRSGCTMATGRFCGWTWAQSAKFSFLLALPTILGGEVIEGLRGTTGQISWPCCMAAFIASFGMGLITVRLAFWLYEKQIVRPFAWYCLGIGLIMIAMF